MSEARKQNFIRREELFFDLKALIEKYGVKKAAVLFCCEYEDNILIRHLKEMGVGLTGYDFSDVSYDREKVDELIGSVDFGNVQLVIAIGNGMLFNAVKFAKASGLTGDKPVLAIPAFIESGEEANGRIIFYNSEGFSITEEKNVMPEYLFYDKGSICIGVKQLTNTYLAKGICQAINVLWENDPESEASVLAAAGMKVLLDNITKIQRDEESCFYEALNGANQVGLAVGLAGGPSVDEAAIAISSLCGISLGQAMMKTAAPVALCMEDRLSDVGMVTIEREAFEEVTKDKTVSNLNTVYERLAKIAGLVAPGNIALRGLSDQLAFVEFALEQDGNDLSKKNIMKAAKKFDRNAFRDLPDELSDEDVRLFVLHTFHRETLERAIRKYEVIIMAGGSENKQRSNIEALKEKYNDDLSGDRIIREPYYDERMKRQKLVKGLQKDVLETLLLSKKLLEENNLTYYLSEGTLLGAIRHKGFIPWDDDVDIMMPREDYNKLVELDREGRIPPELHFDALENNPKHWVLGAKLQLTRESEFVQPKVEPLSEFNGPYIDVFPLDYWNSPHSRKQYRAQRMVKMSRRLLFLKTGYSRYLKRKFHRFLMLLAVPFIPNTAIEKFAIRNMTRFNDGNRSHMVHLASYYRYYKEVFPTSCYGTPLYKEFEGHMFPVPREYDFMLRTIYGNKYDSLPPARVASLRNHPFETKDDD